MPAMNRREFIAAMAAGMIVTDAGLWMPGQTLISIPSKRFFIPKGTLAWLEDGVPYVRLSGGKILQIPKYFDVAVRGFEIVQELDSPDVIDLRAA